LLQFIVSNSLEDFEQLYKRFRPGLVHFATSIVSSVSDAEEIVQDMFMAVWHKKEQFSFDQSLKNYMFTGVKNRCLNHIKKVKLPYADIPDEFPVPSLDANVMDRLQARETEDRIQTLIDMLPTKCKQVFLLSRLHELSYKEIASVMDITPKTVENQIGIALKFLKQGMGLGAQSEKS
jgi:RNA polymerase sigma-70 factor (ECF subfamily)